MQPLTLGYSPCPNDTHMFYALVHGRVPCAGLRFKERLEDVETLNQLALHGELAISKVSCHALGLLRDEYCVLNSGAALGRGCGPLVVARDFADPAALRGKKVALPGRLTTAALLFHLYGGEVAETVFLPFQEIMPAVRDGMVDAGVIIHESRFTFASYGLRRVVDLGDWWERETGLPIPLGCIVARRSLATRTLQTVQNALQQSIAFANAHPAEVRDYIRRHAQEMSDEVCAAHIKLYVNNFSLDLGREGEAALAELLGRAETIGLIPKASGNPFMSSIQG